MVARKSEVGLRILGAVLTIGAVLELRLLVRYARELTAVWSEAVAGGQSSVAWANATFITLFAALMLTAMAGGIQLVRGRPNGYRLVLVGLLPQLLSLIVSGFQYRCAMFGFIGIGVAGNSERVRGGFFYDTGTQLLVGFESPPAWALQLNIGALGALVLLLVLRRAQATKTPDPVTTTPDAGPPA